MPAAVGHALAPAAVEGLPVRPSAPAEFSRGWLGKTDRVRRRRADLHARGLLDGATPDELARWGASLQGTLRIPVVAVRYSDVEAPFPVSRLASRLFGPARGDTLSLASYWDEVSGGLFGVDGVVTSWIRLRRPAEHFLGADEYGWGSFGRISEFRHQALSRADAAIDFSRFDNDGPDGIPNSGDDDGYVDLVVFYYATGCAGDGAGEIWPHRGAMAPFRTDDAGPRGDRILITDYVVLPAQAPGTCDPAHVGVLAHETAHALGLPDLYDYDGSSRGIGSWGLMGTGSHAQPYSPAHLGAWDKEQLGWVRVDWTRPGLGAWVPPVIVEPRVVRHDVDDGSGRYLLFEYRTARGSDRHLPGHGLLVWGVDPDRAEMGGWNSDERNPAVALLGRGAGGRLVQMGGHDFSGPFPGRQAPGTAGLSFPARLDVANVLGGVRVHVRPLLGPTWSQRTLRLTSLAGGQPLSRQLSLRDPGSAGWVARSGPDWLRLARSGNGVALRADPAGLAPGVYTDSIHLLDERTGEVLDRMEVVLDVARSGMPATTARDVSWGWGLTIRDGALIHAGRGWDAFGVRPLPRLLRRGESDRISTTLARLPVQELYAPSAHDGQVYVIGRAMDRNYVYRVDADGNGAVVGDALDGEAAYGLAVLPSGDVLVAGWSGRLTVLSPDGETREWGDLGQPVYQIAAAPGGAIYAALLSGDILEISAVGLPRTIATGFGQGGLVTLAVSDDGRVFAAARDGSGRIVEVAGDEVRELARIPNGEFYGLATDGSFLYALDLGNRELVRLPLRSATRIATDGS